MCSKMVRDHDKSKSHLNRSKQTMAIFLFAFWPEVLKKHMKVLRMRLINLCNLDSCIGNVTKSIGWQNSQFNGGVGAYFYGKGPGTDHYLAENTFTDTVPETSGTQYWLNFDAPASFTIQLSCSKDLTYVELRNSNDGHYHNIPEHA